MRRVCLTDEAASRLEAQIDYLIDHDALAAARALRCRVGDYIEHTLASYPASGKVLSARDLWEVWIPGTRLIVWYQFDDSVVTIITFWHTSQDREPDRD